MIILGEMLMLGNKTDRPRKKKNKTKSRHFTRNFQNEKLTKPIEEEGIKN
jgi:hypothetical protein